MFSKVLKKIKYKILTSNIKPEIIALKNKTVIKGTGRSNMTHISNLSNIEIGEDVFIGHFNYIDGFRRLRIGRGSQITNYVSILTHSSHNSLRYNKIVEKDVLKSGEVTIGDFCYIGAHSTIMPGSKIGEGSIVSAYSYVNGEFPPYSILRGQPARIIGSVHEVDEQFFIDNPELKSNYLLNENI